MTANANGPSLADELSEARREPKTEKHRLGVTNQALIVGVLAAIAGWFLHVLSERNERDAALPTIPKVAEESLPPTVVTVSAASVRSIAQTIDVIGTLKCFEEIPLSTKVDGTVLGVHCDVASRVSPGELLIEIDPESYRLDAEQAERSLQVDLAKLGLTELPPAHWNVAETPSVVQAQAKLNLAENRLRRIEKLAADKAASDADLQAAIGEFETAQAERNSQILTANASLATIQMKQTALEIARRKLSETRISAPSPTFELPISKSAASGQPLFVVAERMVSEGAYLREGTEVLKLVVDSRLKMNASVPEKYSGHVALGQKASIMTASQTEPIPGVVSNIHPTVDPKKRSFDIEIQVDNQDRRLMPGNFAKVSVEVGARENATTVPLESIVTTAGINKIFVLQDGKAQEYPVRLGKQTTEWIEVLDPPFASEAVVITSGHLNLASGSVVQVRESPDKPAEAPAETPAAAPTAANQANSKP